MFGKFSIVTLLLGEERVCIRVRVHSWLPIDTEVLQMVKDGICNDWYAGWETRVKDMNNWKSAYESS